jgi:hypothetical protein
VSVPVPRRAERLLEVLGARPILLDAVLGDLSEEIETRIETQGVRAAQRWYLREVLRSAPHLVLDSWYHLDRRGAISVSLAVVGSLVAVFALENLLLVGTSAMGDSVDWARRMPSLGVACLMLLWTLVDGIFAGFVAAWLSHRVPLQAALVVASLLTGAVFISGWNDVHHAFLIANATMIVTGVLGGATLHALRDP